MYFYLLPVTIAHMNIGGFVSAAGGLERTIERAQEREFDVAMFFIGSPQVWNLPTLTPEFGDMYKKLQKDSIVQATYAHALYLANLGSPEKAQFDKSVVALSKTMQNGEKIGLNGVIFHLGSHKNTSSREGLDRVVTGMKKVIDNSPGGTQLIMENAVQQGDKVGVSIKEIGYVLNTLKKESLQYYNRVSVCFDTCHGFAEGYNYADQASFNQLLSDIKTHIGFDKLSCFHINDSQGELNSHKDRHANIGKGHIGLNGFAAILNTKEFSGKDFILEVPGLEKDGPGKVDRDVLVSLLQD